jgi:hypothetical protein
MAQQTINVGAAPNDGTGTPLRTAFQYTNSNFSELYTAVGPSGNNIVVPGSATITGDLTVATDRLKVTGGNVGIGTATPTNYANYTTLTINGTNGGEIDLTDGGTLRGQLFSESTGLTLAAVGGLIKFGAGTGGTEKMRIDSSGNVGVGVTPSSAKLEVNGAGRFSGFGVNSIGLNTTGTAQNFVRYTTAGADCYIGTESSVAGGFFTGSTAYATCIYNASNTPIQFFTNGSVKATLDASGNLLVGTTSSLPSFANGRIEALAAASSYGMVIDATDTSASGIGIRGNTSTVAESYFNASAGTTVGSIVINAGGVSFNNTSDYRIKKDVQPLTGGLARVNALKPSVYKFKHDDSTGEGFLAHELAEVVPLAVTGEKDAVNEDGSIKPQGVDLSKVVPILVAAIKELAAEVNALKNA